MFDRRRMLLAGAASLAATSAWAQDPPLEESPIDQAAIDVLPNLVTRMAVGVQINGAAQAAFVVDTGANRTAISQELAEALALPPGPMVLVNGVTAAEPVPTVLVRRLFVAESSFQNLILPVIPRARLGVDGLLGVDVLGRFAVTFDVARSQLRLRRRGVGLSYAGGSRLGDLNTLAGRQRFGQLTLVDVAADQVQVRAFIDSGSQYSIGNMALFNSVATRRPDINDRRWRVPVIGATGQTMIGDLAVVREIRLGGATLHELPVIFCDLHAFSIWRLNEVPAMLFGADILRLFEEVTVDFPEREVRLGMPLASRRV